MRITGCLGPTNVSQCYDREVRSIYSLTVQYWGLPLAPIMMLLSNQQVMVFLELDLGVMI